jgi:hypothetical protein
MTSKTAPDCGEWTIFRANTVLVAAKVMQRNKNALVFYGDVASAIDGGEGADTALQKEAIVSCGTDARGQGGSQPSCLRRVQDPAPERRVHYH